VDQGELNKRGWVLQERALSRRTVYFAEKQSYWECGRGVRCETLTRMKNRKASFLGDSNFPHSVDAYVKGMKIQLFQDLYERYSNLALSFTADRPIAIKGLEKRLIRTFGTTGGYGIYDLYLHRCLLWQRSEHPLKRIVSSHGKRIPSWSWMAYDGGIKYMDVPFGEVSWTKEITSPFAKSRLDISGRCCENENEVVVPEVKAPAWDIVDMELQSRQVFLDNPTRTLDGPYKCAIIGESSLHATDERQTHYVLIISRPRGVGDAGVWERIGVGYMERRHIALGGPRIEVRIQ